MHIIVHHRRISATLLPLLAWLSLLAAGDALACSVRPFLLPLHLRVGSDTAHCQFNDIQSAINSVNDCRTVIDITREHTYTNQHLSIDNKPDLTLQGWGDGVGCAQVPGNLDLPPYAPPPDIAPLVSLDGSGSGGRVLTITGNSNVALRNLTVLRGATDPSASGGGIDFNGSGSLTLTRSTISYNDAGFGAGINMNGSSGAATLTLGSDTLIILNTASTSGGGIRVQGNTRLFALQPKTLIGYNHAPNGYGGGLEVLGPARADIGSPGYNGIGVIYDNDAQYGGGMDILTFDGGAHAIVRLFTTDANNPVQVSGNFATHAGGAVYLRPHNSVGAEAAAVLCAYDFRIEDNTATEGAAIYSDADYSFGSARGGSIALNTNPYFAYGETVNFCVQSEAPPALGAVACAAGKQCSQFVDNKAQDQNAQATAGSTILLQNDSDLEGDRFSARANAGAHVLREIGDNTDYAAATLTNCLLADNVLSAELIAQTDGSGAYLMMDSCTIAGNQIGAPYTFLAPGDFRFFGSIVDQPGHATVDPSKTDPNVVAHVLSNDRSTLPDTVYIQQGAPTFADAASGNYRLVATSLGIDSAPVQTSYVTTTADLDRRPRVFDQPSIANNFGPKDLGAYELQPACVQTGDTVFCNGFEIQ